MPTVFTHGPYKFRFYSSDRKEPPHIHVVRDDEEVKLWLDSAKVAQNWGFADHELNTICSIVEEHEDELIEKWHEFFSGSG